LVYTHSTPYPTNPYYYVLNNGKVLAQYSIQLPDDAAGYDYYRHDSDKLTKYDLKTIIIDPEKKKEKNISFNYRIAGVKSSASLNKQDENYSDSFENIVYVYPIVDHIIDNSVTAADIFYMDNNGKLGKSLKMIEGQAASLPERISEDRYLVDMVDGSEALVDPDGNIIERIYSSTRHVGKYFTNQNAIYDLNMELVYDVRNAGEGITATIVGTVDDAVIVSERKDDTMVYYSFRNGEKIKLFTINNYFNTEYSLTVRDFGCVVEGPSKFICYNGAGEELISVDSRTSDLSYSWISGEKSSRLLSFTETKDGKAQTVYYLIYS
jgi:hypothetical protein